jgi:hypothetical protein
MIAVPTAALLVGTADPVPRIHRTIAATSCAEAIGLHPRQGRVYAASLGRPQNPSAQCPRCARLDLGGHLLEAKPVQKGFGGGGAR